MNRMLWLFEVSAPVVQSLEPAANLFSSVSAIERFMMMLASSEAARVAEADRKERLLKEERDAERRQKEAEKEERDSEKRRKEEERDAERRQKEADKEERDAEKRRKEEERDAERRRKEEERE